MDKLLCRIEELSKKEPRKTAVIFKKDSLTYEGLYKKAKGICVFLQRHGIKQSDRVCFSAISRMEMPSVYLGCRMAGAVSVFLDKNAKPENMAEICKIADAGLLLTDKPMGEYGEGLNIHSLRGVYGEADSLSGECDPVSEKAGFSEEEISEILFTSGTTGKPKGVMLSAGAVQNILENTIEGVGYSEDTVLLMPLPLNHSFALRVLRAILFCGGTLVLQNGFTFAKEAENNILTHKCNAMACVPASYEVLRGQMQDAFAPVMSSLKILEFGAGSLSAGKRTEICSLLPETSIYNVWGSSESGGAVFCNVNEAVKDGGKAAALGKPLKDRVETAFLREDTPFDKPENIRGHLKDYFLDTDESHPGRMALRGDMVMSGYWKDPDLTAAALIDGWLITGDMARQDEEGNIFMLGRADDIINMGGEKISPVETENIISRYEYIRDCACIGVPDEMLGQIPVLFIEALAGYDESAFLKWLGERVERQKLPRKVMVLDKIPRNAIKKIDRKALKKLWEEKGSVSYMNPVVNAILSRRSIRKFTDREIPEEILDMILKCGYHAPSGHNLQSWMFTVITKKDEIERLKKAAAAAAEKEKVIMYGFEDPVVLVLVSNDERNKNGCQDASCAAENIMLAAHSYDIGSVWLNVLSTLRNVEPVKSLLDEYKIPADHRVWATIAMGYPAAPGTKLKKKEDVINYI